MYQLFMCRFDMLFYEFLPHPLKLIAGGGEHFVQLFADFVAAEGLFVHNGYCGQLYFLYAIGERCCLAVADFELRHGSLGGVGHHNGAG